jgi:glycosyltransferase involved in cell wall biosynthesis
MSPDAQTRPKISIIMPTLNAGALLDNCLASVAAQTYPHERIEILLADAFSTDATRDIAARYGARVLDDPGTNMEEGKRLALQHATGDYIVFVDADNEFTHPDYLELAVDGLKKNPQALGVESYYLPSAKMSSFCRYVTARLHISDVLSWLMSRNPLLVGRDGEIERWTLPGGSCSYPLGANGFVFRSAELESVQREHQFQDTHVALRLMQRGQREWLRVRGRGVHHYYVQTLWGFVKKRRRAIAHYFRVRDLSPVNWTNEKPPVPLWLAGLYCITFVGPLWHALRGLCHDRDAAWLWHVPASFGSFIGTAWGWWTYKTRKSDPKLVANLQVEQTLRNESSKFKAQSSKEIPKSSNHAPVPPTDAR